MKTSLPLAFILLKKYYRIYKFVGLFFLITIPVITFSQCPGGYTSATVNWDNLDYLHSFGGYGTNNPSTGLPNVSAAMRQTQQFAIGTNRLTINTLMNVNNAGTISGDVTTHTGDPGVYTGADIHYVPTAGQVIIMTFLTEVQNASFTLNDVDRSAVYNVTAYNAANVAQTIVVTTYGATILTVGGTPTARSITATNTALGNTLNTGAATFAIAGPVDSIRVVATTIGSNAEIFLSDIIACVANPGFPNNYYLPYTEPFTGQPAYFLANPQNLHVYMMNTAGGADYIFSDPGTTGNKMNSLAYDPVNKWLYYVMDNYPAGSGGPPFNKSLKKYDFNTETISTVLADITTLNLPTFIQGIEFAGAAFYNGSLYLGIEGTDGVTYSTNIESFIWKIDFDGAGVPTTATQVFATPGDDGAGNPSHDWGDFAIKDGLMITHATGPVIAQNRYVHFNMQTGASTVYVGNAETAGQIGQTYNGNVYRVKNHVALYNNDGTIGTQNLIATTSCSPAWAPNAGDASDPFKPKCDFGDAPASYDPVALSPAVNQKHCNNSTLMIGATWDREWSKNTSADASGDATDEDGIGSVTILNSNGVTYNHVQQVTVRNNTGSAATLGGWLDYNVNGVFDASEGVIVSVPSTASGTQTVNLAWLGLNIPPGTANTFLRIRLVSGSTPMTTSNSTGWYDDGETEDYPVVSSNLPLSINLLDFNAYVTKDKTVELNWSAINDNEADGFEIQRSLNQNDWVTIGWKAAGAANSFTSYTFTDNKPLSGRTYYRLRMVEKNGSSAFSNTKLVYLALTKNEITILPNPVNSNGSLIVSGVNNTVGVLHIRSLSGQTVFSKTVVIGTGENRIPIEVSSLNPGIYIVELVTKEKTYTNKLSVNR